MLLSRSLRTARFSAVSPLAFPIRTFTTTSVSLAKALPPRPKPPPESEIEESYVKGSGPGGQKIVRAPVPRHCGSCLITSIQRPLD